MTIREYISTDLPAIGQLTIELQQHIVEMDPEKLNRAASAFDADAYIDCLLNRLVKENGKLIVAEEGGTVRGFIAGTIPPQEQDDLLDHYPVKEGRIDELIVAEEFRGRNIGGLLMEAMESYFHEEGCEYIRTGVFAPNISAHRFYEKQGYEDRYIEMLKKL